MTKNVGETVSHTLDLMQSIGPVVSPSNSMFGGYGFFLDGLMFALMADEVLYLKFDDESEYQFEGLGLEAFSYHKNGGTLKMSYYQAPEEALENQEQMMMWASRAYSAAMRVASKKSAKKRKIRQ